MSTAWCCCQVVGRTAGIAGLAYMDDRFWLQSMNSLKKLAMIYESRALFDPVTYEIIFHGTKEQLKDAIKLLEKVSVKYTADSKKDEYLIIIEVEAILLKKEIKNKIF